jgi:hypothetical protein
LLRRRGDDPRRVPGQGALAAGVAAGDAAPTANEQINFRSFRRGLNRPPRLTSPRRSFEPMGKHSGVTAVDGNR